MATESNKLQSRELEQEESLKQISLQQSTSVVNSVAQQYLHEMIDKIEVTEAKVTVGETSNGKSDCWGSPN